MRVEYPGAICHGIHNLLSQMRGLRFKRFADNRPRNRRQERTKL